MCSGSHGQTAVTGGGIGKKEGLAMEDRKKTRGRAPKFDEVYGLVPVIIQDFSSKEVLMQAFMNKEAWEKTLETNEVWFWSRSRKSLWHKGETSGNMMIVKEIRLDCDCDCVLLLVKVQGKGVTCHTGKRSCFFREVRRK